MAQQISLCCWLLCGSAACICGMACCMLLLCLGAPSRFCCPWMCRYFNWYVGIYHQGHGTATALWSAMQVYNPSKASCGSNPVCQHQLERVESCTACTQQPRSLLPWHVHDCDTLALAESCIGCGEIHALKASLLISHLLLLHWSCWPAPQEIGLVGPHGSASLTRQRADEPFECLRPGTPGGLLLRLLQGCAGPFYCCWREGDVGHDWA